MFAEKYTVWQERVNVPIYQQIHLKVSVIHENTISQKIIIAPV